MVLPSLARGRTRPWRLTAAILCMLLAGCATPPPGPQPAPEPEAAPAEVISIPPPRVIVIVTVKDSDETPATEVETATVGLLMARDIPLVDRGVVQRNREKIRSLLAMSGDAHGAEAIGMQFGADVIIRGEAEARQTAAGIRGSNLNSYQGTVTLRAILADDGHILATSGAAVPVIALDAVSGSARALQAAAEQAANELVPALLTAWNQQAGRRPAGALALSRILAQSEDEEIRLPPPPHAHQPQVAAIWQLTPQVGVPPEWMEPLTETLYAAFTQSGWFRLVTRGDMEKIMTEHNIQLSDLCDTTERAVEFGKILSARKMLIGTVGKLGATYQVVMKLVDVETGEIEGVGRAEARGAADVLFRLTQRAAIDLVQPSGK